MLKGQGYQRGGLLSSGAFKNVVTKSFIFEETYVNTPGLNQLMPVYVRGAGIIGKLEDDDAWGNPSYGDDTGLFVSWIADDAQLYWNSAGAEPKVQDGEQVRIADLTAVANGFEVGYLTPSAIEGNPTNLTVGTRLVPTNGSSLGWSVFANPFPAYKAWLSITRVEYQEGVGLSYYFKVVQRFV